MEESEKDKTSATTEIDITVEKAEIFIAGKKIQEIKSKI